MGRAAGGARGSRGRLHIGEVRSPTRPLRPGCTEEVVSRTTEVGWHPEQPANTTEASPERPLMDRESRTAAVEPEAWSCCWGTDPRLPGACDPGSPGGTGAEAGGAGSYLLHLGEAGHSSSSGDEGPEPTTPRPGRR